MIIFISYNLDTPNTVTIDCDSPFDEVTIPGTAIISPNFPRNYDDEKDCEVTIRFSTNQKVAITIEAFDVESHFNCGYDFLDLYDGDSTDSPIIGSKLCDSVGIGTKVLSTGNVMTLHFHSDTSVTESGFKLYANAEGEYIFSNFNDLQCLII